MMRRMKKYFLAGLVTLLPLALTIAVVKYLVIFLTKPFMGAVTHLLSFLPMPHIGLVSSEQLIRWISEILILVSLFFLIIGLGILARWFFFTAMMKFGDILIHKIPIVNKVYKTAKEIIHALFASGKNSFQEVVMVPFPNQRTYVLGLVTHPSPDTCSSAAGNEMISVFLPSTPNPTTGYLVMRPKSELIVLDMSTEDAIKYVVSCGAVLPKRSKETS